MPPSEAVIGVRKDLLDAYQARLVDLLEEATEADERGFAAAFAENAAIAAGYWPILAPEYQEQRAPRPSAARPTATSQRWPRRPQRGDAEAFLRGPRQRARRPRRLHGRPLHPGGAGAPRPPAHPLPRPDPDRVRPRDRGRRGDPRLRDPGGRRLRRGRPSAFSDLAVGAAASATPPASQTVKAALDELDEIIQRGNEGGEVASLRTRSRPLHDDAIERPRRDVARGVDRGRHRGRLRPGRDQPRPDGGRGQRRRARAGRAGPAQRLRVLRVRPGALPARRSIPSSSPRSRAWSGTAPAASRAWPS